jgi:hypothetical protein
LKALKPQLIPWFNQLYSQRCDYAHKGFVIADDRTSSLVSDSIKNVMSLLAAKLSVN